MIAGRYELERPLGHGAMAVVDLARDIELDRRVALKRLAENLARDDELRARFVREARLAARLAHPNVVRVYDVGEDGDRPFIAMEYVEGETLAELTTRAGPLPAAEAAALGVQLCRGLAAVHDAGLVHRDVKPQNVMLRRDGVLKLGDFGIAFGHDGTRLTIAGTVLGTAAYLAPEQARGEQVTAAADIYGLGAVLHELVTGRPPRTVASLADLARPTAIAPPVEAPRELGELIAACLAQDPADRPASAAEVELRLTSTDVAQPTIRLARRRRRVRPAYALAAAALSAIVGGVAALVATTGGGSSPSKPPRAARIAPVPHGSTPAQQAQNLAAWLQRYSR
jgi:eukaryotic-like serine/threonine-protein kinase